MSAPIRFWFDFVSPFAYLAFKRAGARAQRHDRELELVPVLFAAMLDHHGHLGPAEIPPKRELIFRQCVPRAARRNLRFSPPPSHPFNPLLGLRVASLDYDPGTRAWVVERLYDATWGGGPGIEDPAIISSLLDGHGLDGRDVVERAQTPENKQRVRIQTERAIASGVFGVPSFLVDGELFWGDDAIEDIDDKLAGRDPNTVSQRWPGSRTRGRLLAGRSHRSTGR